MLLAAFLPEDHRDAIIGDLEETFARKARDGGPFAARRWFWGQAVGLSAGFARERFARSGLTSPITLSTVCAGWEGAPADRRL